jgi:hypothetical protein
MKNKRIINELRNPAFRRQLKMDSLIYGAYSIELMTPNLFQRLFRIALKRQVYVRRIDPRNLRVS